MSSQLLISSEGVQHQEKNRMGMTFGGENGFKKSPRLMKALDIIYETEQKKEIEKPKNQDFQENMLLSFYNWPKVETSSVLGVNKQSRRQDKRTSTLKVR
jgi:hypothetical protein